ncbi:hypothetical protein LguiA_031089 [Lonicera macranthoides]
MDYDRIRDLQIFDDTKAGVKGLLDSTNGIIDIPKIFIRPPEELAEELNCLTDLQVPSIDLNGIERGGDERKKVVEEVRRAAEEWGFFHVANHGVPTSVLNKMLEGIRLFHEQDVEVKREWYSRDKLRKVKFNSNYDLYKSRAANWRDTLSISMLLSEDIDPNEVPLVCREAAFDYMKHIEKLGETFLELLSEALGLNPDHLRSMECHKGRTFVCHYYPACPDPDLTLGIGKHTDAAFLTILLQDQIGGLQVLHDNQWADVHPIQGGLVVNIGDMFQIISNGKFKSVIHRVLANRVGPRISVACFFAGIFAPPKIYSPIKELISEESPIIYKEFTVSDYVTKFYSRPLDHKSGLDLFKL